MPKRKREDEETAAKAKKRVPVTAPTDAATEAIIARNASSSPLLRMPFEIRNKIWAEVLGGELIHVEYISYIGMWTHVVCQRDSPENEMAKHGPAENVHLRCDRELAGKVIAMQMGHKSMHLTALRVCRQMYNEANKVLWSTNTFSFNDDPADFVRFIHSRTTRQKLSLRRLRLQMDWDRKDYKSWNRFLDMTLIRSLAGLTSLRLHINWTTTTAIYRKLKAQANELGLFHPGPGFTHQMAILPLTDVEVFVSTHPEWSHKDTVWTVEDRMECAEGIRQILLDPKGAEIFAQNKGGIEEVLSRRERERSKERWTFRQANLFLPSEHVPNGAE